MTLLVVTSNEDEEEREELEHVLCGDIARVESLPPLIIIINNEKEEKKHSGDVKLEG